MNRVVLASFVLMMGLSACAVPNFVTSDHELPPMVMRYQKVGQYGHTDPDQRKEDIIACGVPQERYGDTLAYMGGGPPSETFEQFMARRKRFSQCMKDKGYVQLGLKECGPVKENRGICK